jgi:hypothetical protein
VRRKAIGGNGSLPLFKAFEKRRFGRFVCFLCGCRLGHKNRSEEHVFPKWLQSRFQLQEKQLVLLNGTSIRYKQLTIPCCKKCNNEHLSPIEKKMQVATYKGVVAVRRLGPAVLFLWLGKIFYGLLYREYLLRLDRKASSKRTIVPRETLERLRVHHLLLQASRLKFRFMSSAGEGVLPASILVVRTQQPRRIEHQFDFRDSPFGLFVSIRMGKIGIVAALQDGGALDLIGHPRCRKYQLHPLQFQELTAQMLYKASLLNRTPKFLMVEEPRGVSVILSPLSGLSLKPIFDSWKQEEYATVLSGITQIPREEIFVPPNVMTWLRGPDGKLRFIDVNEDPIFG